MIDSLDIYLTLATTTLFIISEYMGVSKCKANGILDFIIQGLVNIMNNRNNDRIERQPIIPPVPQSPLPPAPINIPPRNVTPPNDQTPPFETPPNEPNFPPAPPPTPVPGAFPRADHTIINIDDIDKITIAIDYK